MVVHSDKNLDPCISERLFYIYEGFPGHLSNDTNHKPLSARIAPCKQQGLQYLFREYMSKSKQQLHQDKPMDYICLAKSEYICLHQAIQYYPEKWARFQ